MAKRAPHGAWRLPSAAEAVIPCLKPRQCPQWKTVNPLPPCFRGFRGFKSTPDEVQSLWESSIAPQNSAVLESAKLTRTLPTVHLAVKSGGKATKSQPMRPCSRKAQPPGFTAAAAERFDDVKSVPEKHLSVPATHAGTPQGGLAASRTGLQRVGVDVAV